MNKAKQLYELQEVDLNIEHKTQALTQVKSQLGKDDDLVAARAALDSEEKRLADLEHQQKTSEWELNELGSKISVVEKKYMAARSRIPESSPLFSRIWRFSRRSAPRMKIWRTPLLDMREI